MIQRQTQSESHSSHRARPAKHLGPINRVSDWFVSLCGSMAVAVRRLKAFLDSKTKNTRRAYEIALRDFSAFLGREFWEDEKERKVSSAAAHALLDISSETAVAYMAQFRKGRVADGSKRADSTVSHRLVVLWSIYQHLMMIGAIKINPFEVVWGAMGDRQHTRKREPRALTADETTMLINSPDASTEAGRRDRAILVVLFGSALRRSEGRNLRLGDVRQTQKGTVFVNLPKTKSGKSQAATLSPRLAHHVLNWVEERRRQGATDDDWLFVMYRKYRGGCGQMSEASFYRAFKRYAKQCGLKISPHAARHTAITRLRSKGVGREDVQRFARLASSKSMDHYDHHNVTMDECPGNFLDYDGDDEKKVNDK